MHKLFDLSTLAKQNHIEIILIQIDEAHSDDWPMYLENQVPSQKCFEDRINRANHFISRYHPPYPVYIDSWDNTFANLFRAWPDKYYCVDQSKRVVGKSEYSSDAETEALILVDCTVLLQGLFERD